MNTHSHEETTPSPQSTLKSNGSSIDSLAESQDSIFEVEDEGRNICRTLSVSANVTEEGVDYTMSCRISLPSISNQLIYPLFNSTSSTSLLSSQTYSLPLASHQESEQTTQALKALGIPILNEEGELPLIGLGKEGTVGRAMGRKKGSGIFGGGFASDLNRIGGKIVVYERDGKVEVEFVEKTKETEEGTGIESDRDGNIQDKVKVETESIDSRENLMEKSTGGEWLIILDMRSTFEGLCLPKFANHIQIPTPLCLRNSLQLNLLPPPPSSSSSDVTPAWDLATTPSLKSNSSTLLPVISGTFELTNSLSLRWSPQELSHAATIQIPHSNIEVKWGIGEEGFGTAEVLVKGELNYVGVSEKSWIEFKVVCQDVDEGLEPFEVLNVEGDGILGWEICYDGNLSTSCTSSPRMIRQKRERGSNSSSEENLEISDQRQRVFKFQRPASRKPSYTSIFDVQPPINTPLDSSVFERNKTPSLMRQSEPTPVSEIMMDMSFEMGSESNYFNRGTQESRSASEIVEEMEADEQGLDSQELDTIIRINLDLDELISNRRSILPTFEFTFTANFPSVTLLSLSRYESSSSTSDWTNPVRFILPSFSIPISKEEQTVVTVSGGIGRSVELLTSTSLLDDDSLDSPLPAIGGNARWKTVRVDEDENENGDLELGASQHRRNGSSISLVEVEVSLPPSPKQAISLPQSRILTQTSPYNRQKANSTPTSLRNKSRTALSSVLPFPTPLSLSYLRIKITPVPPITEGANWRLFNHLRFPVPFVGTVDLPTSSSSKTVVELEGAWDEKGLEANVESDLIGNNTRINSEGVKELLFSVSTQVNEETQKLELGDILPILNVKVAALEVELVPVVGKRPSCSFNHLSNYLNEIGTEEFPFPTTSPPPSPLASPSHPLSIESQIGYEFDTSQHTFDTSTPSSNGVTTTFSKFLLQPNESPKLSVHLIPVPSSPSIPTVSIGVPEFEPEVEEGKVSLLEESIVENIVEIPILEVQQETLAEEGEVVKSSSLLDLPLSEVKVDDIDLSKKKAIVDIVDTPISEVEQENLSLDEEFVAELKLLEAEQGLQVDNLKIEEETIDISTSSLSELEENLSLDVEENVDISTLLEVEEVPLPIFNTKNSLLTVVARATVTEDKINILDSQLLSLSHPIVTSKLTGTPFIDSPLSLTLPQTQLQRRRRRKSSTVLNRMKPFFIWILLLLLFTFSQIDYSQYDQFINSNSLIKENLERFKNVVPSSISDFFKLPTRSDFQEEDSEIKFNETLPSFNDTFLPTFDTSQNESDDSNQVELGEILENNFGLSTLKSLTGELDWRKIFVVIPVQLGVRGREVFKGLLRFLYIL